MKLREKKRPAMRSEIEITDEVIEAGLDAIR
jgi:hypothetical protein